MPICACFCDYWELDHVTGVTTKLLSSFHVSAVFVNLEWCYQGKKEFNLQQLRQSEFALSGHKQGYTRLKY